ncbi:YceI family protein [Aestuariivivens sediminis]|uniref:YceI family protein n=1 Tax=Aestuariivivens sediminis TaxID=2913557 RepID=UPI001F571603|nr:YceI family protein [Aestuariivivens sediminis]
MGSIKNKSTLACFLVAVFYISFSFGQVFKLDAGNSSLKVFGTSSLHDWHIQTDSYNGTVSFTSLEDFNLDKLQVNIVTETLKSGKKSMDKNTYKALKTDKFPKITFHLTQVKGVKSLGENRYIADTSGDLFISGTKRNISLQLKAEVNGNTIKLIGEKTFLMTDFNVDPPTALLGTITTGDEITIKFESIFKQ